MASVLALSLFASIAPLGALWMALSESTPPCWATQLEIRCSDRHVKLPLNLLRPPQVFNGVALVALMGDDVAPELQKLKSLVQTKPKIFFSLTDLALPEIIDLPESFRIQEGDEIKIMYESPMLFVSTKHQTAWRVPESSGKWMLHDRSLVATTSSGGVLLSDGARQFEFFDRESGRLVWTLPFPVDGSADLEKQWRVREKKGPLLEILFSSGASITSFWINWKLGVWVHRAPVTSGVAQQSAQVSACPKPAAKLPDYGTQKQLDGTPLCFDYKTLQWTKDIKGLNSAAWSADDTLRFWDHWVKDSGKAQAVAVRRAPDGKIAASAFFQSQQDMNHLEWTLQQLCGGRPQENCDFSGQWHLLPQKQ